MTNPKEWKRKSLQDLLSESFDGSWGEEASPGSGTPVIRSTDMRGGKLSFESVACREVPGRIVAKKQLVLGDILVNKSSGSSRLVGAVVLFEPAAHDRVYMCSNFIRCLRPDVSQIDSTYLYYFLQSPYFRNQVFHASRTTSGLRNLNLSEYVAAEIAFPDKPEQLRLVGQIQAMMVNLDEVESLSIEVPEELTELKRSLVLGTNEQRRPQKRLSELVEWVQDSEVVKPNHDYVYAGIKSFGKGLFVRGNVNSSEFAYKSIRRLKFGDFIFPKLMAWEGAFAMVSENYDDLVVSPEFVVFRPKDNHICSEVLDTYFRSPLCLEDVNKASTGSNRRRRRLNPKAFLTLTMPVPSEDDQQKLKAVYRLEADAEEAWQNRSEEIKAIRDSILRKAFAGEL
jgi:type I restriction enzyme S subunit